MTGTVLRPAAGRPDSRDEGYRRKKSNWLRRHYHRWQLLSLVVLGLGIWEFLAHIELLIDPLFVSQPSAIIQQMPSLFTDPDVRGALALTGSAMVRASAYGTLVGIAVGYVMGFLPSFRDAFYAPFLFLLSVPKSMFIPIFMVFFGITAQTAVYYGAFSGFIYVLINVVSGFDLVEEGHLRVAKAYGASNSKKIRHVVFPASVPGVFAGIWYGIKNGLQGVLIFELFVSIGGIGQSIVFFTNSLRADRALALVMLVSIAAILAGSAWTALERRLNRWRPQGDGHAVTEQAVAH